MKKLILIMSILSSSIGLSQDTILELNKITEDKFSLDITGNIIRNHQFNTPNYVVNPKECELIFFPSYLHHKVLKNKSKTTRYSIAFNIYVKGNLKSPTSSLLINTSIKT